MSTLVLFGRPHPARERCHSICPTTGVIGHAPRDRRCATWAAGSSPEQVALRETMASGGYGSDELAVRIVREFIDTPARGGARGHPRWLPTRPCPAHGMAGDPGGPRCSDRGRHPRRGVPPPGPRAHRLCPACGWTDHQPETSLHALRDDPAAPHRRPGRDRVRPTSARLRHACGAHHRCVVARRPAHHAHRRHARRGRARTRRSRGCLPSAHPGCHASSATPPHPVAPVSRIVAAMGIRTAALALTLAMLMERAAGHAPVPIRRWPSAGTSATAPGRALDARPPSRPDIIIDLHRRCAAAGRPPLGHGSNAQHPALHHRSWPHLSARPGRGPAVLPAAGQPADGSAYAQQPRDHQRRQPVRSVGDDRHRAARRRAITPRGSASTSIGT